MCYSTWLLHRIQWGELLDEYRNNDKMGISSFKEVTLWKNGLLIMDNHKWHINEKVISKVKALKYDIEFFPPNTTGYLQPLDLNFNGILKRIYWQMGNLDNRYYYREYEE